MADVIIKLLASQRFPCEQYVKEFFMIVNLVFLNCCLQKASSVGVLYDSGGPDDTS